MKNCLDLFFHIQWNSLFYKRLDAGKDSPASLQVLRFNLLYLLNLVTWPSAIISKTWYWPPLFSTIVVAISMMGAKDVGPTIRAQDPSD